MDKFDQNLRKKDILLVEDDLELRESIESILTKMNYSVVLADSFNEAVKQLLSNRFQLIISDINLGQSSGLDILTWVKQNTPTVRVVLMTGYLDDTDIHDALDLGVFGFLAKPMAKKEIQKITKNALGTNEEDKITDIDYARVDIDDFLTGKILNFPVYIRLKDSRFLKIAHSGTEIDIERLNQLSEKEIKELWIDKDDLPSYLSLNERIISAKNSWNPGTKIKFLNHLVEISHESMRLLNMSKESIRYCLDSLDTLTKEISVIDGSLPLITPILDENSRASKLAVLGASYSLVVARVLDWTADKTLHSLAMGALFRDISLTQEGFNYNALFGKDSNFNKTVYKEHPNRSAAILEEMKEFSKETISIVQHHHEDGTPEGFPNKLPKSRVFAPALLVNYVDTMLMYMMQNSNLEASKLKDSLIRYLTHKIGNSDEKALALILLIKHGDIDLAKKEFGRLKKLSN